MPPLIAVFWWLLLDDAMVFGFAGEEAACGFLSYIRFLRCVEGWALTSWCLLDKDTKRHLYAWSKYM